MSITSPRIQASNQISGTPSAAAETAIVTINGISTRGPADAVLLRGIVNLNAGTAATAATLTLWRDSGAGGKAVASSSGNSVTAGDGYTFDIEGIDTPGEVAEQQYTLLLQMTGATAATAIGFAQLTAIY